MKTIPELAQAETDAQPARAVQSPVLACLCLDFERDPLTRQTVLAASHQEAPLRVLRAFTLEDGTALVHLHNVSGGLLGGDRLALRVRLDAGSNAQLTTTGATRLYRPRQEAPVTFQANEITVGEDALLEYLPDQLIPFAGARFSQRTSIRLARGAGLFWWEVLAPGREARGEIFEYASVELKTDLIALGKPIVAERVRLEPGNFVLSSLSRLGPCRTWATFYVCRVGLETRAWLALEQELRKLAQEWTVPGETFCGISTLAAHGLVVRCAASHGRHVLPGLRALWRAAKLRLYGREAVPPRKVY